MSTNTTALPPLADWIKTRLGPLWWYTAILFCVQRFSDLFNIFIGLWLVPRYVPADELGAVLPLGQISALLGLPLAIMLVPFTKFLNAFGTRGEFGKVKALLRDALRLTLVFGIAIACYTWYAAPFIFERLRIGSSALVWILCGIAISSAFLPVLSNALQALKRFRVISATGLLSAPVRMFLLLLLLPTLSLQGFFSAQLMQNMAVIAIAVWGLRRVLTHENRCESYWRHKGEILRYTLPVALIMAAGTLRSTAQLLTIRQRLPDVESAAYYFCSRFSEIPNILWGSIAVAFFPLISEAFEKGRDTRRPLLQAMFLIVVGGMLVALMLSATMPQLFALIGGWRNYQPYAHLVGWLAMINVLHAAVTCFTTHEMACRRFGFAYYVVPIALLEAVTLVSLTGYGFFDPYLPKEWVAWMASLKAARLEFIVGILLVASGATFLAALVQMARYRSAPCAIPVPAG